MSRKSLSPSHRIEMHPFTPEQEKEYRRLLQAQPLSWRLIAAAGAYLYIVIRFLGI